MKKLFVIFGVGDIVQFVYFYFSMDFEYEVVVFIVDVVYFIEM